MPSHFRPARLFQSFFFRPRRSPSRSGRGGPNAPPPLIGGNVLFSCSPVDRSWSTSRALIVSYLRFTRLYSVCSFSLRCSVCFFGFTLLSRPTRVAKSPLLSYSDKQEYFRIRARCPFPHQSALRVSDFFLVALSLTQVFAGPFFHPGCTSSHESSVMWPYAVRAEGFSSALYSIVRAELLFPSAFLPWELRPVFSNTDGPSLLEGGTFLLLAFSAGLDDALAFIPPPPVLQCRPYDQIASILPQFHMF